MGIYIRNKIFVGKSMGLYRGGGLKPGGLKVGFYGILKMIFCIWKGYMRQEQQLRNAPVKPTNILSKYTGWKTTQAKPLSHTFVYSWLQFLTTSFSN